MIEYKLTLAGSECAIAEWNPSGSILVFALHGWLDNLASFEAIIKYMPNIRLVAVDFPGHGHSSHIPAGLAYHFIDGLYLIDDLAAYFKQKKINLLGHSMGGAVSTLYAASQTDKVAGLVLIESLGPLTAEPEQAFDLMSKAVKQRRLLRNKRKPVYPSFEEALIARAEASNIEKALIKPLVERALTKVEGGYTWRADPRLRIVSPLRMSEKQLNFALSNISAPVLLIEGTHGLLESYPVIKERKKQFKILEVHLFEGGHHVHLEKPEACGEEIASFFMKLA